MKPQTLEKLSRAAGIMDAVTVQFGKVAAIVTYLLLALILAHVTMRYVFRLSLIRVEELQWHLYAVSFLLGLGYTYVRDAHVRVDLFYETMSSTMKAWVNVTGVLVLVLPFCIIIGYFAFEYFEASLRSGERSQQPGGLPARYVLKFFLVLGLGVLAWQSVSVALRSIYVIGGGQPIAPSPMITEEVKP